MNKLRYFSLLAPFLCSCASAQFSSKDIQGVYVQKENTNIYLEFKGDAFAFVEDQKKYEMPLYQCDTITYGNWKLDRNLIYVSSPRFLSTFFVNAQVKEKSAAHGDTLYFTIDNPVERHCRENKYKTCDVSYNVAIYLTDSDILDNIFKEGYYSNFIKIPKPKGAMPDKFEVHIYPKANFGRTLIREVSTLEYKIKDKSSNFFEINIPELDYGYLSYVRLNKDIIRVMSKNELEWDGHTYSKK
jgi:hypothetical protein